MSESEDNERLWNLALFKLYMTDREMEDAAPSFIILGVICLIVLILIYFFF